MLCLIEKMEMCEGYDNFLFKKHKKGMDGFVSYKLKQCRKLWRFDG